MKMGWGQLICLVAGAFLIALGGGLVGGRLAVEKYQRSLADRPAKAAAGSEATSTMEASTASSGESEEATASSDVPTDLPAIAEEKEPFSLPEAFIKPTSPSAEQTDDTAGSAGPETTVPREASRMKYVIQALSAPNRRDAREAREKIMAKGFPAGIFEADLGKKGKWYRIIIGPYNSEAEAKAALKDIHSIPGFQGSFVKPVE